MRWLTQQRDRDMWRCRGRARVWHNIDPGAHWICKEEFSINTVRLYPWAPTLSPDIPVWSLLSKYWIHSLLVFLFSVLVFLLFSCPLPESPVHPPSPPASCLTPHLLSYPASGATFPCSTYLHLWPILQLVLYFFWWLASPCSSPDYQLCSPPLW